MYCKLRTPRNNIIFVSWVVFHCRSRESKSQSIGESGGQRIRESENQRIRRSEDQGIESPNNPRIIRSNNHYSDEACPCNRASQQHDAFFFFFHPRSRYQFCLNVKPAIAHSDPNFVIVHRPIAARTNRATNSIPWIMPTSRQPPFHLCRLLPLTFKQQLPPPSSRVRVFAPSAHGFQRYFSSRVSDAVSTEEFGRDRTRIRSDGACDEPW